MKKLLSIMFALNIIVISYGQTTFKLPANLNTGAELIELAMLNTVVSLEQDYALRDSTGQKFGRDGMPRFNSIEFIGICTTDGIIFLEDISSPWRYDADFQPFQESYTPCLSESRMKYINTERQDTVVVNDSLVTTVENKYFILRDSTHNSGLHINVEREMQSNGWFVWLIQKKNENVVAFNAYKRELPQPDENGSVSIKQPNVQDIVLGGFYVSPFNSSPGTLQFYLDAVLIRNKDDMQKWDVIRTMIPATNISDNTGLTPITNNLQNEK